MPWARPGDVPAWGGTVWAPVAARFFHPHVGFTSGSEFMGAFAAPHYFEVDATFDAEEGDVVVLAVGTNVVQGLGESHLSLLSAGWTQIGGLGHVTGTVEGEARRLAFWRRAPAGGLSSATFKWGRETHGSGAFQASFAWNAYVWPGPTPSGGYTPNYQIDGTPDFELGRYFHTAEGTYAVTFSGYGEDVDPPDPHPVGNALTFLMAPPILGHGTNSIFRYFLDVATLEWWSDAGSGGRGQHMALGPADGQLQRVRFEWDDEGASPTPVRPVEVIRMSAGILYDL